jgi:hypothetical protein
VAAALEPFKDQNRINISRVCTRALQEEIEKMQLLDRGLSDRDALITRLRQEKREASAADEKAGREQAAEDVRSLDYTELVGLGNFQLNLNYIDRDIYWQQLPEWVKENLTELLKDPETAPTDTEAWAYGWLAYAQAWWDEIQHEL